MSATALRVHYGFTIPRLYCYYEGKIPNENLAFK